MHIILPKPVIETASGRVSPTEGFAGDFVDAQGNFPEGEWNKALQLAPVSSCRRQMPEFSFRKKSLIWNVKATGLLATRSLFSKCLEFHFSLLAWHRAQKFPVSVLPVGFFCDFLSFPA